MSQTPHGKRERGDLALRSYSSGDEKAIARLYQDAFGRELPLDFWRWKFREGPDGPAAVELAWNADVLAGHYAVSQTRLLVCGRPVMAGLVVSTMVHSDFRGHGLFSRLGRRAHARAAKEGLAMLWTFPPVRRETHRLFVRDLGFVDIHEIPKLQADLAACQLGRCPPNKVRELTGFDQRFDSLWERVKADHEVIALRDALHLQWRYCRNPATRYRVLAHFDGDALTGYAVVKRYEDELQVVDVLTEPDPDIGVRLVCAAAELAAQESARTVGMWLNYSHPLHRRLEALGFRIGAPVTYFCGRTLGSDMPAAFVYDFRKWYVTMGDSDVY